VNDSAQSEVGATAWLIRGGGTGEREQRALAEGLTFMGWPGLGDLTDYDTRDGIRLALKAAYPDEGDRTIANWMGQVWLFRDEMAIGDYVVMPLKARQGYVAIGSVTGDYEYRETEPNDFRHIRTVHWLRRNVPLEGFGSNLGNIITYFAGTVCVLKPDFAARHVAHLAEHGTDPGMDTAAEITTSGKLLADAASRDRVQEERQEEGMARTNPWGEVPDASISSSQGILMGSGNVQNNTWVTKPPPDPAAMRNLNSYTAVAWLQELEHRELVKFFARAEPGDVSEIIAVFLEADEAKVVAVLADVNRRQATELLRTVPVDETLAALPDAEPEIARKAASLKWTDAGPLERLQAAYFRKYKQGHVFWVPRMGVHVTTGVMDDYFMTGPPDRGYPVGDQESAPSSPFGTEGVRQWFIMGAVYSSRHGTFSEGIGAGKCYQDEGKSGGWLGFPVDEYRTISASGSQRLQAFEGGTIYYNVSGSSLAFAVRREVLTALPGGVEGFLPTSKEAEAVSSSGMSGTVQDFEFTPGKGFKTAVYSSDFGTVTVAREVWRHYSELGAEKSWLGFPVERASFLPNDIGGLQKFERGAIYWRTGSGLIGVPAPVMELIEQTQNLREPLGFPVTEEQSMGPDESDRIQFFERGIVTLRDGKYEIWVRPDAHRQMTHQEGN
jgi:hypothetical protein